MKNQVYFDTPRLILRDWNEHDLPEFKRMNLDPRVTRYFRKSITEEDSERFFQNVVQKGFSEDGFGLYAVELKENHTFIGFIGFHRLSFESFFTPCIEIGWRLKPEAWGFGYATEGAKECLRYGFETLGFDKIYSNTPVLNVASESVMKRILMKKIENFMYPGFPEDSPLREHVLYVMDKKTYFEQIERDPLNLIIP